MRTTMVFATLPFSIKQKTPASALHCENPQVNKYLVRCACHWLHACFKPHKLLFSLTIFPENRGTMETNNYLKSTLNLC